MAYGMKVTTADGYIGLHSDYSSVVYAGEMELTASRVRPVYTGDYSISIASSTKVNNYAMGWLVQYRITLDVGYIIPFYAVRYDGQSVAILDVVNEDDTWVVNLLYEGEDLDIHTPRVFAFAPLSEIPNVTKSDNGFAVYNRNSELVFTDNIKPLRVDDVVPITFPSSIKLGSRGSCGNSTTCHVNYVPDQSNTLYGNSDTKPTTLYHLVPSAYGGLAYKNSGSGSLSCSFFRSRKYAWSYQSWASFRGVVSAKENSTEYTARWRADYAGALHQYVQGSCGFGGFLGALIGIALVVVTGGAALALVGGALAGFVIGELTVSSAPAVAFYDTDTIVDTNNTSNLMTTDGSYYGIDLGYETYTGTYLSITYYFSRFSAGTSPYSWTGTGVLGSSITLFYNIWLNLYYGVNITDGVGAGPDSPYIISVSMPDGYTYYRGEYKGNADYAIGRRLT